MNPAVTLKSGVASHARNPKTFHIPSEVERNTLTVGQFAKLMFYQQDRPVERMWVQVTEVAGLGKYKGRLDNDPVCVDLKCDDPVEFEAHHIISITS